MEIPILIWKACQIVESRLRTDMVGVLKSKDSHRSFALLTLCNEPQTMDARDTKENKSEAFVDIRLIAQMALSIRLRTGMRDA